MVNFFDGWQMVASKKFEWWFSFGMVGIKRKETLGS